MKTGLTLCVKRDLKPFWNKYFSFNHNFGLFLILAVCIPRFLVVLHANVTRDYSYIAWIMIISGLAPFIFLSGHGLTKIGLTKPESYSWLFVSFFIGLLFSLLLFFPGEWLYGHTFQNWYVYIGDTYNIPGELSSKDRDLYFIIFAITGMIFSPIGEELYFRGIVHSAFAESTGEMKASLIDSLAFALTHISHFGLVYVMGEWKILTLPTIIWVLSMFIASIIFFRCRKYSGSIFGAVLCHSGFNLGMTYCIFYLI